MHGRCSRLVVRERRRLRRRLPACSRRWCSLGHLTQGGRHAGRLPPTSRTAAAELRPPASMDICPSITMHIASPASPSPESPEPAARVRAFPESPNVRGALIPCGHSGWSRTGRSVTRPSEPEVQFDDHRVARAYARTPASSRDRGGRRSPETCDRLVADSNPAGATRWKARSERKIESPRECFPEAIPSECIRCPPLTSPAVHSMFIQTTKPVD